MVSFPVGGVDEVVEEGVTGLVVASHDPALMAEAVLTLLDDDEKRAAMSRAGRLETVRFSASATAEIHEARLAVLLAEC